MIPGFKRLRRQCALIGCLTFWPPNGDLSTYPIMGHIHPDDLSCRRGDLAAGELTMRSSVRACVWVCVCLCGKKIQKRNKTAYLSRTQVIAPPSPVSYPSLSDKYRLLFAAKMKQHICCPISVCVCDNISVRACGRPGLFLSPVILVFSSFTQRDSGRTLGQASILSFSLLAGCVFMI